LEKLSQGHEQSKEKIKKTFKQKYRYSLTTMHGKQIKSVSEKILKSKSKGLAE
jgi:hypothetical protein